MSRYFSNKKNTFLFLLCIIFSGILYVAEQIYGVEAVGRTGGAISPSERSAYEEGKALEAYEKRNDEIDSWIKDDVIPSHGNAALLYYQALLLQPDHDQVVINRFYDVYEGAEPDTQIRIFLGKWLPSMKIYEVASRMPECIWGVWPEQVWPEEKTSRVFLLKSFRHFSYIIAVDAITLASDAHYRAALERCMTLRRIARHLSYDAGLHLSSNACDTTALTTIRRILGEMTLDTDVLAWFQGQLATFQESTSLLERTLQKYLKAKIDMVQSYSIPRLRGILLKRAPDKQTKQQIQNLTDTQIRNQALEAVQSFFGSIFAILHSNKNAEQKYAELREATTYTKNEDVDVVEPLMKIYFKFGEKIPNLITDTGLEMTEQQKLSEIQKIIDKSAELNTIELFTRFSKALGKDTNFDFLVNREMTDKQKLAEMQKVIYELADAFAIETFTFGVQWHLFETELEPQFRHAAQMNSLKAALELYLVAAKTGHLPKELPNDLPKDPYTDRDFLYEITDDGFVLGCRSDIFLKGKERFTFHFRKKKVIREN